MSIVFFDGFDTYAPLGGSGLWDTDTVPHISAPSNPRFSTSQGALWFNNNSNSFVTKIFPTNYTQACVGFAFYPVSGVLGSGNSTRYTICQVLDTSSSQLELSVTGNLNIVLTRNGTVLATSTQQLTVNSWCYIQWELEINNSTTQNNKVTVYGSNGTVVYINLATGSDTQNSVNSYFNRLNLGAITAGQNVSLFIDDFYFMDTSDGSTPLGDVRVHSLLPNGNGFYAQFTNQGGTSTNNYLSVDDSTDDGESTYVEGSTVGFRDSYAFTDLPSSVGTIFAVQLVPRAEKTDAGSKQIAPFFRISGVDYDQATIDLTGSYIYVPQVVFNSPATGTAWGAAEINSMEAGIKVVT